MRLTTDFWVSAYLRQSQQAGEFAGLLQKGAMQAGAVFVVVNRLDGTMDLYSPAPQALFDQEEGERLFCPLLCRQSEAAVKARIEKEMRFDRDLWIIERESRAGTHGLTLVSED